MVREKRSLNQELLITLITAFSESRTPCGADRSSGTLMSFTCPVAKSSKNSAGFIAISGMNLKQEKYSMDSLAFP